VQKPGEVDGVGHRLVAGVVGMQGVAAVVGGVEVLPVEPVLCRLRKVDDPIEADPVIDCLPLSLGGR
jgi:hypothetical protein